MEENMPQSNATMKRSLTVMVAVGTSSLASAMGISTSTLASSITIVGNAPTSVTALEITARDATANQAAVEKAALVGSAFFWIAERIGMVRGMMDKKVMLQKYSVSSIDSYEPSTSSCMCLNSCVGVALFMFLSCQIQVYELPIFDTSKIFKFKR